MTTKSNLFTKEELEQIAKRGSSLENVISQIEQFKKGFDPLEIVSAAVIGSGITELDAQNQERMISLYENNLLSIMLFVPASGAATRMFKELYEFDIKLKKEPTLAIDSPFFKDLSNYPFYYKLEQFAKDIYKKELSELSQAQILELILTERALNYGALPKGLIDFHWYGSHSRTAFEEHLCEAAKYIADSSGAVNMTFTVAANSLPLFKNEANRVVPDCSKLYNVEYNINYTTQKESTDTIAVTLDNNPYRGSNGKLLFRPAGHGALIENLNDVESDIIIIKNIDNIAKEEKSEETLRWKKILIGALIELQAEIFNYLRMLDGERNYELYKEIREFLAKRLTMQLPVVDLEIEKEFLKSILNRPIRVCGMVKNEGEPGGGPFLVKDADGVTSLQIVESAQINWEDAAAKRIAMSSTHFNPVDIVCSIKNYRGHKFDLINYVDKEAGFISLKNNEGVPIKALELPGLWNGAMSRWNTLFVEVPLSTFNPVKSVDDLLRPAHLGE